MSIFKGISQGRTVCLNDKVITMSRHDESQDIILIIPQEYIFIDVFNGGIVCIYMTNKEKRVILMSHTGTQQVIGTDSDMHYYGYSISKFNEECLLVKTVSGSYFLHMDGMRSIYKKGLMQDPLAKENNTVCVYDDADKCVIYDTQWNLRYTYKVNIDKPRLMCLYDGGVVQIYGGYKHMFIRRPGLNDVSVETGYYWWTSMLQLFDGRILLLSAELMHVYTLDGTLCHIIEYQRCTNANVFQMTDGRIVCVTATILSVYDSKFTSVSVHDTKGLPWNARQLSSSVISYTDMRDNVYTQYVSACIYPYKQRLCCLSDVSYTFH